MSKQQVHEKFRFFTMEFDGSKFAASSKAKLMKFLNSGSIHAKSIGGYMTAGTKQSLAPTVMLCIGYTNGKNAGYDITAKKLGKSIDSAETMEANMLKLAAKTNGLICHEFFQSGDDVYTVFLKMK